MQYWAVLGSTGGLVGWGMIVGDSSTGQYWTSTGGLLGWVRVGGGRRQAMEEGGQ